jgi:putative FmdB family regulatory protein
MCATPSQAVLEKWHEEVYARTGGVMSPSMARPRLHRLARGCGGGVSFVRRLETGPQLTGQATAGKAKTMPHYEFYCEHCKNEVTLTLSIGQRERGDYKCPGCGGKKLEPLMGTFFSQMSRKA